MKITQQTIDRHNLKIVSFSTLTLLLWGALIAGLVFEIFTPALFILSFFAVWMVQTLCLNTIGTRNQFFKTAINSEDIKILQMLLDHDYLLDVNTKRNGNTLLIWAARNGHVAIVEALLEADAKADIKGQYGDTALIWAARNGHVAIVEALLEADAKADIKGQYGDTALIWAAKNGHTDVVTALLAADAKPNIKDEYGHTALIWAAKNGHTDVVTALLAADAKPNIKDEYGHTALIWAAKNGHTDVVKALLLKMSTDAINAENQYGNTALIWAALKGYTDIVTALLAQGAKPNAQNNIGNTALILAVQNGHVAIVKALLATGAKADIKGEYGHTALIWAAKNGHTDVVKALLLKMSTDAINAENQYGNTALIWAAQNGHVAIVEALLEADAKADIKGQYGDTALIWAAQNGHVGIVQALLNADADPDIQNQYGDTALIWAAKNGHTDVVTALLAADAKPNIKDEYGHTALIWAAKNGHTDVVKALLLKMSTDAINAENQYGNTALIWAAQNGHVAIVEALLEADAKADIKGQYGNTALIWAAKNGHTDVVKALLLKMSTDAINAENQYGNTALIWAARNGRTDIVRALLDQGADPNIKGEYGNTALIWAAKNGHTDVVKALLLKMSTDAINAENQYGNTALIWAAQNGRTDIVRALLDQGADPNIKGEYGNTALIWAAQNGRTDIVRALLDQGADPNIKGEYGNTALTWATAYGYRTIQTALQRAYASRHMLSGGKTPLTPQGDRRIRPNNRPHYTTLLNLFKEISGCDFNQVKRHHSRFEGNVSFFISLIGIAVTFLSALIASTPFLGFIGIIASILPLLFFVHYKITQPPYPTLKTVDPDQISTYLTEHNLTLQLSPSTTLNHSVLSIDQTAPNGQTTRLAAVPWHQLDSNLRHNLQTWLHQNIELHFDLHFKKDQKDKDRLYPTLKSHDQSFAQSLMSLLQTLDDSERAMLFQTHPDRFKVYGFSKEVQSERTVTQNGPAETVAANPAATIDNPAETEKSDTIQLGLETLFNTLPLLVQHLDHQDREMIAQTCRGAQEIINAVAPPISIEGENQPQAPTPLTQSVHTRPLLNTSP